MTVEPVVTVTSYDRWRATTLGRITERVEVERVFALAGDVAGKRVLDVGTGDGTYAIEAALRGAHVSGVDPQTSMLDAAAARARARSVSVGFERATAEALPFPDETFDVALAVTVLCFVKDPAVAIRDIARTLRPGGRLVIGELSRSSIWALSRRVRGWLGSSLWGTARFWSRGALRRLVREAGLVPAASTSCIYFPPMALAARVIEPLEPALRGLHTPGAAFIAIAADKQPRNGAR